MLIGLLVTAGAVFVLNKIGMAHHLYWRFWWYDVMMHFLGGVAVGGFAAWAAAYHWPNLSHRRILYAGLIGIAVVGIGWEFFEFFTDQYIGQANIAADTMQDLIMDTIGTVIAWFALTRVIRDNQLS